MKWWEKNLGIIVAGLGLLFFLTGNSMQTLTNTTIDYSALGVFIFVLGIILYISRRRRMGE